MSAAPTTSQTRALLKAHGLRYSAPRAAILAYLRERNMHVSAESLHRILTDRGEDLSLSTLYLNLGVLRDAGLLRELRGVRGEAIYDSNTHDPHYHLICKRSGQVVDVPAIDIDGVPLGKFLKEQIEAATGWVVEEPEISLRGESPDEANT